MDPQFTRPFRASIVARARFIEDLVIEQAGRGLGQYGPAIALEKFTRVAAAAIVAVRPRVAAPVRTYIMPSSGIWMPQPEALLQKPNQS